MTNLFANLPEVGIAEVLAAKDALILKEQSILERYPEDTLLSLGLNIPGPVKTSPELVMVFDFVLQALQTQFDADAILYQVCGIIYPKTGPHALIRFAYSAYEIKKIVAHYEVTSPYGRLLDGDVVRLKNGEISQISRTQLGLPTRKCLICQKDAKVCGRNRTHSIPELQAKIEEIIEKGRD